MGDRPIRYALTALALVAAAGGAGATVRTAVVAGSSLDAVPLSRFNAALGTLLQVSAEVNYQSSTGYLGFTPSAGFDHGYTGSASLGGMTFGLAGNSITTDLGNGSGYFTVNAVGSASWSSAADLARLASGSGSLFGSASLLAPAPGQAMGNNARSLSYKLTYTYDDATAVAGAVPEPATWAMMAGGFTFVGLALRSARRRSRTSPAASEAPTAS